MSSFSKTHFGLIRTESKMVHLLFSILTFSYNTNSDSDNDKILTGVIKSTERYLVFINVSVCEYFVLKIKLTKWNLEDLDCKIVFGLILWCQIFYIQIVQPVFIIHLFYLIWLQIIPKEKQVRSVKCELRKETGSLVLCTFCISFELSQER